MKDPIYTISIHYHEGDRVLLSKRADLGAFYIDAITIKLIKDQLVAYYTLSQKLFTEDDGYTRFYTLRGIQEKDLTPAPEEFEEGEDLILTI